MAKKDEFGAEIIFPDAWQKSIFPRNKKPRRDLSGRGFLKWGNPILPRLIEISINGLDAAIIKVGQLGDFDIAQMGLAIGELGVVVKQIPFAVLLHD